MKIVSTAPYDTLTYEYFRREVDRLIAQTKVKNLSEAELLAVVDAAVEGWRARAFPKSWIMRARVEAACLPAAPETKRRGAGGRPSRS